MIEALHSHVWELMKFLESNFYEDTIKNAISTLSEDHLAKSDRFKPVELNIADRADIRPQQFVAFHPFVPL